MLLAHSSLVLEKVLRLISLPNILARFYKWMGYVCCMRLIICHGISWLSNKGAEEWLLSLVGEYRGGQSVRTEPSNTTRWCRKSQVRDSTKRKAAASSFWYVKLLRLPFHLEYMMIVAKRPCLLRLFQLYMCWEAWRFSMLGLSPPEISFSVSKAGLCNPSWPN